MLQPAVAAYGAAFNAYLAEALGVHTDQPYRVLPSDVSQQWNWQGERQHGSDGLAMSSLEAALLEHPAMRVLIVNGRYDLVTPYLASRWLVDQLEIPAAVRAAIQLRVYEGGTWSTCAPPRAPSSPATPPSSMRPPPRRNEKGARRRPPRLPAPTHSLPRERVGEG